MLFWPCKGPSRVVDAQLKKILRNVAIQVAGKPRLSAIVPLLVALVFSTGLPLLRTETEYINLWYPTDTPQWRDLTFLWDHFGHANRTEIVIATAAKNGPYDIGSGNAQLLEQEALLTVLSLQKRVQALPLYGDVCSRSYYTPDDGATPKAPCVTSSVLDLWGADPAMLAAQTSASVLATVNQATLTTPDGMTLYRPALLGDVQYRDDGSGDSPVKAAGALQVVFSVDRKAKDAEDYEANFAKEVESFNREAQEANLGINFLYMTGRSFKDDSQRALDGDSVFVTFAMMFMIVYVSVMLGRIHWVESKVLLSFSIIVTIIVSLVFAFGISGWLGWPLTQLSLMSIFILLGVGVDDMFIIVDSWNRHAAATGNNAAKESPLLASSSSPSSLSATLPSSSSSDATERLIFTFVEVGGSILMTSLTDFVALMIGSSIAIPAVSNFCRVAALSVLAVFMTQLSFFSAMLFLDQQRIEGHRMDVLFCFRVTNKDSTREITHEEVDKCTWSLPELVWDTKGWWWSAPIDQHAEEGSTDRKEEGATHDDNRNISNIDDDKNINEFKQEEDTKQRRRTSLDGRPSTSICHTGSDDSNQLVSLSPFEQRKREDQETERTIVVEEEATSCSSPMGGKKSGVSRDSKEEPAVLAVTDTANTTTDYEGTIFSRAVRAVGRFLLWPRRAVFVVIGVLCLDFVLGWTAMQTVETSAEWADFLPKDSTLLAFYKAREDSGFGETGTLDFVTTNKLLDLSQDDVVAGLKQMEKEAHKLDFVVGLDSWFSRLETWVVDPEGGNSTVALSDFADGDPTRRLLLKQWVALSAEGARYAQWPALVFAKGAQGDQGFLTSARMVALTSGEFGELDLQLDAMHEARKAMAQVKGVNAIAITLQYGWMAREERIWHYTTDTIMKTLLGVIIVALLFLEPWLAVATTLSVALVTVALFGTMGSAIFNINLNVSSFINLVLAIGFAVDYSAHVAQGYMAKTHENEEKENENALNVGARDNANNNNVTGASDLLEIQINGSAVKTSGGVSGWGKVGTPRERMGSALEELGGSVLNGGLSTLLGVLVLSFSKSVAFQTLFQMFLGMVLFGLLHGLVFLPCFVFLVSHIAKTLSSKGKSPSKCKDDAEITTEVLQAALESSL